MPAAAKAAAMPRPPALTGNPPVRNVLVLPAGQAASTSRHGSPLYLRIVPLDVSGVFIEAAYTPRGDVGDKLFADGFQLTR